ncbi:MAG TPA: hypothetical protein DDZ41_11835 [Flavobacterium sp.]|nr:hypothetical protein [Flavobacterium sp.]
MYLTYTLFCCNTFFAQKKQIFISKDTVTTSINPLRPAKAAFYSAILPGLGQAYNKKYWKIPLVYGGFAISIYSYTFNQKAYHNFRDEYKRRLDGTSDPNHPIYGNLDNARLISAQKFHQRNRDLSMLMTVGIYILNIIDANVDAHLMQFNVNEKLSLKPDFYQNSINSKQNISLSLNYNF